MNQSNFVVLGGGMVAGYAAKQLVELGLPKGELAILSADNAVPYERPPLSKSFLAGKDSEDAIKINPEDFYKKQRIVKAGMRSRQRGCQTEAFNS
jgi:NAD(P)H-nitrite reductase large subunit